MKNINAAPITAFIIAVAFLPGISGAATSPRWAIAAVSLWFMEWYCLPFAAFCFFALDFDSAVHWAIICAAFSWGLRDGNVGGFEKLQTVIRAFAAGIACSGAIAILQTTVGFDGIPQIIAPAGLFANKNIMGEAACLAFVMTITYRQWLNAAAVLPALLLAGSRASLVAAMVALGLVLWQQRSSFTRLWFWSFCASVFILAGVLFATVSIDLSSLSVRLSLWGQAATELNWLGNGSYDYSTVTVREPNLHNDWLQLIYELGIVGCVPMAIILAATTRREFAPFVAALVVIGFFGFPFQMPTTAWFAAFVIGASLGRRADRGRIDVRAWSKGHDYIAAHGRS